jgi:hypothetical protein
MLRDSSALQARPLHAPPQNLARGFVRCLWHAIRLPALAILLAFEPFVSLILVGVAFMGLFAGIVLRSSGDLPGFPFWGMVAFSTCALLVLIAYHTLIAALSREQN